MGKIIVIGSSNTDMVIKSAVLPAPGETVLGGDFIMNPGGKGANQAVAAARLEGDVLFITKTGNDIFGRQAIQLFEKEGIDTRHIATDPDKPSGVALIMVDDHGENSISVALGANGALNKEDIDRAASQIISSTFVLMQLEIPLETVAYAADLAAKNSVKVILNPAPAQFLPDELLQCLYMITPNETETELLTGIKVNGEASAKKAAAKLKAKGVENVIITLGSAGAFISGADSEELIPAPTVKAIDTTAAGDTFNGALVTALSEGKSLKDAASFAVKAASLSVTKMGAQASVPYRKDLNF